MRDALQNEDPLKNIATNPKSAALVAAVLALSAALIDYLRHGEINLTPILGTLFLLALAFSLARSKASGGSK